MRSDAFFLTAALCVCAGSVQGSPILFRVVDLGTLGGTSASATAINRDGLTAGFSSNTAGDTRATGSGADITPVGAQEAQAAGINASGQIAGTSYLGGTPFATVWSGTSVRYLGSGSYGLAINDAGSVTGMSAAGDAFLYSAGVTTDLGTLASGSWSAGYAINSSGQVAGYGDTAGGAFRGFIWSAGSGFRQLGTLGGLNSYAFGVNSSGLTTGSAQTAAGYLHAFLATNTQMLDLGTLGGTTSSGYGINAAGDIVGYSTMGDGSRHAFLFDNGAMIDLNNDLIGAAGWDLTAAYAINDAGQIAGSGLVNGVEHAFRLDPVIGAVGVSAVPEPASVTLVAVGLGMAVLSGLRRRRR